MADPSEQGPAPDEQARNLCVVRFFTEGQSGAVRSALGGRYRPGGSDPEQIISNRIRC